MIRQAVLSGLPLITISTRDVVNLSTVLNYVSGKKTISYKLDQAVAPGMIHYVFGNEVKANTPWRDLWKQFMKASASLVIVNSASKIDEAFDAGELIVPRELIRSELIEHFSEGKNKEGVAKLVDDLMPAFGGLTMKEVVELIRLTTVDKDLTPQNLIHTRKRIIPPLKGFTQVDTAQPLYLPSPDWKTFVQTRKKAFLTEGIDYRLVPRGALLDGPTGTGKTSGAKYLAEQWGVPLYRMDASAGGKYHNETETAVARILAQVAHEAPCALLLDEAEKMLGTQKDSGSGVTEKVQSLLLWFMQENRDKVFILLTTNKKEKLPPEMYRSGRISETFTFLGLNKSDALALAKSTLATFKGYDPKVYEPLVDQEIAKHFSTHSSMAQADIAEAVTGVLVKNPPPG